MTFTLIGFDSKEKEIGIISFTKVLSVGAFVPLVDIEKGAIASQSFPNVMHKERGLNLLKNNSFENLFKKLLKNDKQKQIRQILIMDKNGNSFGFTGNKNVPWAGHLVGKNCICGGNMLKKGEVIEKVISTFEHSKGQLVDRLVKAMEFGLEEGGDKRKRKFASVSLNISKKDCGLFGHGNDYFNLRVDWSQNPLNELKKIIQVRKKAKSFCKGYKY